MDQTEISKYDDQVVAVVYDRRPDHTLGIVHDSVFYEIRMFDPRGRDNVVLIPLDYHRIDQLIPIEEPLI